MEGAVFEMWAEKLTGENSDVPPWAQRVLSVVVSLAEIEGDQVALGAPLELEEKRGWKRGAIARAIEAACERGFVSTASWSESSDILRFEMSLP